MAEEIETPGEGQVRALVTVAGNPVLSTPNGSRLDRALAALDFMVSLDIYMNETTRHADVILPPPSPLARCHYDARAVPARGAQRRELLAAGHGAGARARAGMEQLLRLTAIVTGQRADADLDAHDSFAIDALIQRAGSTRSPRSRAATPPKSARTSATGAGPVRSTSSCGPGPTR